MKPRFGGILKLEGKFYYTSGVIPDKVVEEIRKYKEKGINIYEAATVLLCLKSFGSLVDGVAVKCFIDNS